MSARSRRPDVPRAIDGADRRERGEVAPTDTTTYVAVALGLLAVALVASWIPARRAARIDPITAQRHD